MSKKRKRISRRRLAGQRVMAHVPIYHIETGKHKPVTAARRFIAENALSAPSVFNVRRNEHTTDRFFWGEKGLFSAQYACLLYTSPSPRDKRQSRMPSSA